MSAPDELWAEYLPLLDEWFPSVLRTQPVAVRYIRAPDSAPNGLSAEALNALASYQQADIDGVMVLVSRQALDEAIAALRNQPGGAVPRGDPVAWRWWESKWNEYRYCEDQNPYRDCEPLYTKAGEGET